MAIATIVSHYYNGPKMVERYVDFLHALNGVSPDKFEYVLVDDHSTHPIPIETFDGLPNLQLYRVSVDVPWNQAGARNIGAEAATCPRLLFLDIDHIVAKDSLSALAQTCEALEPRERVLFARQSIENGEVTRVKHHLNSFLVGKDDFWQLGAYNELFVGAYGCEDKYFEWCAKRDGIVDRHSDLVLEVDQSGRTAGLDRSVVRNRALFTYLIAKGYSREIVRLGLPFERLL